MSRCLIAGFLCALTAVCIYTAYITGKTGNMQSAWFFGAFALFFAIPLLVVIIRSLGQKNSGFRQLYRKISGPEQEGAKFVPHWFMTLLLFVFSIVMLALIIKIIQGFAGR